MLIVGSLHVNLSVHVVDGNGWVTSEGQACIMLGTSPPL